MAQGGMMVSLFVTFLLTCLCFLPSSLASLEILDVQRGIDLSSQIAAHSFTIKITNTGGNDETEFVLLVENEKREHLSYLEGRDVSKPEKILPFTLTKGDDFDKYVFKLSGPLKEGAEQILQLGYLLTRSLKPFPTQITQDDPHFVRYRDNHYFFSQYPIKSQETRVRLGTVKIESFTEKEPTILSKDVLKFGPYLNVQPLSRSDLVIHFENNTPFLVITNLIKEYEISMWGNLAVEEHFEIEHTGAKLVGPFSRFDFQRHGAPSAVPGFASILPAGAKDAYYRDEIGNISTSRFNVNSDNTARLDIFTRYIMFGGWKVSFYIGYNLPLSLYLSNDVSDSSRHILNVTFAKSILDPISIDHQTLRIVFPEGATNIEFITPFALDGNPETDTRLTYLDTIGRPVLILKKDNLVRQHDQYFQVSFTMSKTKVLMEPLLLIGAFLLFFGFIILFVRLDLSITPDNESKEKKSK